MPSPTKWFFRTSIALFFLISHASSASPTLSEKDLVASSFMAFDNFMIAGKERDMESAAKWLADYDRYPPRAHNRCRSLIKKKQSIFQEYLSISDDVYGYELKRGPLRTSMHIEGAFSSSSDVQSEYSVKMVYQNKRWRLVDIEID